MVGDEPGTGIRVAGKVVGGEQTWQLELDVDGPYGAGHRTLRAGSCAELADAAALVIAIAINPELDLAAGGADPEPEVPKPEVPDLPERSAQPALQVPEPPDEGPGEVTGEETGTLPEISTQRQPPNQQPTSEPPEVANDPIFGFARTGGGVGFGFLPSPAATLGATIGVGQTYWRAALGIDGWFPRETVSATNPAVGGSFSLWAVRLSGCGTPRLRRVVFPLCIGVNLGAMRGTGEGSLAVSQTASAIWSAGLGSAGLMWNFNRFGLWLDGSVAIGFVRPAFHTDQTPEVYRAGRIGGQLRGGLEIRFP